MMLNEDQCWEAVERRDAAQDGRFYFGVLTTGVYCRPSCAARRPLRKNVRFYRTSGEAERDGLRPCRRCRPTAGDVVAEACRYIDAHADESLTLESLAQRAGLSAAHFQRRFKRAAGVTPKQYHAAARLRALKGGLRQSGGVTEAVYQAGYGSASRVYERADSRLGMTPRQYREGGRGTAITYATVPTPLGLLLIGATDRGLCALQFGEDAGGLVEALRREYPRALLEPMRRPHPPEFDRWVRALDRYLKGERPRLNLPLDIQATAFQLRVWNYLQGIPYGAVQSYSEVAAGIGRPSAARAVARACASNRLALAIPCHRVIRGTGELGGYRWGLARKRALLDLERRHTPHP